ncbi:regena domain protein [Cryptosporidium ryanae]|uniref:regena domain protein n=1 Tax=Cryptosporidium ryanae TaxID=515981 RepID=UPI00351AA0C4|nr:regena domain protein [Cryptosporidium ryanae]
MQIEDPDLIQKIKSDINSINSSIVALSNYKLETRSLENEIEEIQQNISDILKEHENVADFTKIPILERLKLDECYKSIINIKNIISRYEEKINISDANNDLESFNRESILKEISELKISKCGIDEEVSESESGINSEEIFNNLLDDDNENIDEYSDDYFSTKRIQTEYKNSMGFCIEMFPKISTDVLDSSFENKLTMYDSIGKHIQYTPRMVWHNPRDDFPSVPLLDLYNPCIFDKLDLDTLFFIFYFQQGTFQQFLAIQELKRKKWRFHKKCFAWFLKRSESKVINDDVDVADYVYFDFEKDWCQKIKNDFAFEFIHLDNAQFITRKLSELAQCDNEANSETVTIDENDIEYEAEK